MVRRTLPRTLATITIAASLLLIGATTARGTTSWLGLDGSTIAVDDTATAAEAVQASAGVSDGNGDGVRRVVIVGDSLVVGAEDEITEVMEAHGVEVTYIAVSGTGILTSQAVRTTQLTEALAELEPDVVILESCCNYDGSYVLADGRVVGTDTDLLWTVWEDQARTMTQLAQAAGADVYWVITPQTLDASWFSPLADRIQRFNDIYRSLGVALVDWQSALYPDGTTEGLEELRNADGLHLTDAGDELVAAATWAAVADSLATPR